MLKKQDELMKNSTLLSTLSSEEIEHFLKNGLFKMSHYKKNSVVHLEGEPCNQLDIILSGKLVLQRIDESGNLLVVADFYSNDTLGGNLLFSKRPYYPMTLIAHLPSVILQINKELITQLFTENKAFLMSYLEFMSDNATLLGLKIKHYVHRTIRESIVIYLNQESIRQNNTTIQLNMTKKMFSEKIGVQRTSLSRELKKMQDEGLIKFDAKSITLLN